jgi:3-phosphoshikimate 1-carboxyvinyltransferase
MEITPATALSGIVRLPGDKSISHRYVMLGAVARGDTRLVNTAPGADVAATIRCMRALGVEIQHGTDGALVIAGRGWNALRQPAGTLDAGNSGTTLRLLAGLLAGRAMTVTLTGDASLRRRPMARVIDPLHAMGATVTSEHQRAPITVTGGRLRAIEWRPPVPSAQVKSAVMLAALSAEGTSTVTEPQPTRDHSERAFPAFGLEVSVSGNSIQVPGTQEATAPSDILVVPGDPSSAAVWAAGASALPGSEVVLEGVGLNPRRLGFVRALRQMGAEVGVTETATSAGEPVGTLVVRHHSHRHAAIGGADVPDLIDELPVLAARAALGGSLEVAGAAELRVKESDRISALVAGFRALGVDAVERADGFVIRGANRPTGGHVDAAGDHRLVMAFAIVGLGASAPTYIAGADAVAVSYPGFASDLARLRQ